MERIDVVVAEGSVDHPLSNLLDQIVTQPLIGVQRENVVGLVPVLHVVEGPIALGRKPLERVNDNVSTQVSGNCSSLVRALRVDDDDLRRHLE